VFGDATLRDMARRRPSTVQRLLDVHGVGQQKAADFGQQFVDCILAYCQQHDVTMDVRPIAMPEPPPTPSAGALQSFPLFDEGLSVEETAQRLGRATSTTYGYLESYIRYRRVTDATRWISQRELEQIQAVVEHAGAERLRPIYDALHGRIGYERIRIAVACLANQAAASRVEATHETV
jgi:ATP-dependent DNA helicase RecQ